MPDFSGEADGRVTIRSLGRLEGSETRPITLDGEPVAPQSTARQHTRLGGALSAPQSALCISRPGRFLPRLRQVTSAPRLFNGASISSTAPPLPTT